MGNSLICLFQLKKKQLAYVSFVGFFMLFQAACFAPKTKQLSLTKKYQQVKAKSPQKKPTPHFEKKISATNAHPYFWYMLGRMESLRGHSKKAVHYFLQAVLSDLDDPFLYYSLGLEYAQMENIKKAKNWFLRAVYQTKKKPTFKKTKALSLFYLAKIAWHQKKYTKAKKLFGRSLDAYPYHLDSYLEYISLLAYFPKTYKKRFRLSKKMLVFLPKHHMSYFSAGKLHQENGDWEAAKKHFLTSIRLKPNHKSSRYHLAKIYETHQKYDQAALHYYALYDHHSHLWQANVLASINRLRNGSQHSQNKEINRLISILRGKSQKQKLRLAEAMLRWLNQRGMASTALRLSHLFPKQLRNHQQTLFSLVDSYYILGRYKEAYSLLRQEGKPQTHFRDFLWKRKKLLLLQKLGHKEQASRFFQKWFASLSSLKEKMLLSKALLTWSSIQQKEIIIKQWLSQKKFHKDAEYKYFMAALYFQANMYQKSFRLLKALLNKHPDHVDALHLLAKLYFKRYKSRKKARYLLNRAIQYAPNNPKLHNALGLLYLKERRLKQARKYFLLAKHTLPTSPSIDFSLASLEAFRGNLKKALRYLKSALRKQPSLSLYREIKKLYKQIKYSSPKHSNNKQQRSFLLARKK